MSEPMLRHQVLRGPGMELTKDRQLLAHLGRISGRSIREDETDTRLRGVRLLGGGVAQLAERLVEVCETHERLPQIRARDDVVIVEGDRATQVRRGLRESALLAEGKAEIVEGPDFLRRRDDRATQRGLRFRRTTEMDQGEPEAAVRLVAIRPERERLLEMVDGNQRVPGLGGKPVDDKGAVVVVADRALG